MPEAQSSNMTPSTETAHTMQCMEVWGGNTAVDNGVIMPGLDAWVYAVPFRQSERGGDVHYVSSCATGRITRLLLADISGHGQSVGEAGSKLRTLMRRYVNYLDQSRFVASLNREFNTIAQTGGFATAVAATYWAPTSVLMACNAGHPRPLWYRAKARQWQFLEPGSDDNGSGDTGDRLVNLPLGVIDTTDFEQFGVRLSRGDVVILYTDSLIEAMDESGRQLGEQGLLDLIRDLDPSDPQVLRSMMLERIDLHRDGREADDDVTILMLRHNGSKPRQTLGDRVHANIEFIKSIVRRLTRGRAYPIPWPQFGFATWGGAMISRLNNRWGGVERDT